MDIPLLRSMHEISVEISLNKNDIRYSSAICNASPKEDIFELIPKWETITLFSMNTEYEQLFHLSMHNNNIFPLRAQSLFLSYNTSIYVLNWAKKIIQTCKINSFHLVASIWINEVQNYNS